jgi:hypothetical protein
MVDLSPSATSRLDGQNRDQQSHAADGVEQLRADLATAREKIANLERALTSNRRIGAAVGILMYRHKITYDQAFELLRVASQESHRKLHDIAEDVLTLGQISLPHGLHRIQPGTPTDASSNGSDRRVSPGD